MAGIELFGDEERKEVNDVLETGILFRYGFDKERKGHWKTKTFEKELAEFNKVKYCHSCSSGSTAVSIAMASAGIGAGDHVIVPSFTFMATIEAVLLAGAVPVFAEIDETLCLSPEGIEAAITPQTTAVVLVHMCGSMAKIDEIVELCKKRNITLIEDTAQALGATYKGKAIGTFGVTGSFSFDFFKIITCGEGGAVITNDENVYEKMHTFGDHGHNHVGNNRGMEEHPRLGFNFRIGELNAAVGLAQLRKLPTILKNQKANKKRLKETLSQFSHISFRNIPDEEGDSSTFMDFFLPDEATTRKVVEAFKEVGVDGANYWYDNNYHYLRNWEHIKEMKTAAKLPIQLMENLPQDYQTLQLPETDGIISRLISLCIKPSWTDSELDDYCEKLEQAMKSVS